MAAGLGEKEAVEHSTEEEEKTREDEEEDDLSTGKRARHSKKHKHKHSKKHKHKHKKRKHKKRSSSRSRSKSSSRSRSRSPDSNAEEDVGEQPATSDEAKDPVSGENGQVNEVPEIRAKSLTGESDESSFEGITLVECESSSFKLTKSPSGSTSPKEQEMKETKAKAADAPVIENKVNLGFPLRIGSFSKSRSKSPDVGDQKVDKELVSGTPSETRIETRSGSHDSKSRSGSPSVSKDKKRSKSPSDPKIKKRSRSPSDPKIKKRSRSPSDPKIKKSSTSPSDPKINKRSRSRSRTRTSMKSRSKSPRKHTSKRKSRSKSQSRSHNKHRSTSQSKSRSRSPRTYKRKSRSRSRSSPYSRKKSKKERSRSRSVKSRSRSPREKSKASYDSKTRSKSRDRSRRSRYDDSPRRSKRDASNDRKQRYNSGFQRTRSRSPRRRYSKRSRSRSVTPRRSQRHKSRSRSPRRGRSRSPKRERYRSSSRSRSGRYRCRSRSRSYSSRRRRKSSRSKSRSRDRSPKRSRSKSKEKDDSEGNKNESDKKGVVPAAIPTMNSNKPTAQDLVGKAPTVSDPSNKRSLAQLTEFCKKLTEARGIETEGNDTENKREEEEEEDTSVEISHPFLVAPKRDITIPQVIFPVRMLPPPLVSSDKPLTEQFPVSCGTKHHEKEQEEAGINEVIPDVDGSAMQPQHVFQAPQNSEKLDISSLVVKRMDAQRKLQVDPNDVDAMLSLQEVEMKLNNWCQSNVKPGQYTGQLVKTMMPKEKFNSGYQAWAKKDMFHNLNPVCGGVGMKLLQKMGWEPGQVLGKRGEGMVEPIALTVKVDRRGLSSNTEKPVGKKSGGNKAIIDLQGKHPISSLQEYCARRKWQVPEFTLIFDEGPPHSKQFLFKVAVNGYEYQHPVVSSNKKHAKAQAAVAALKGLGLVPEDAVY